MIPTAFLILVVVAYRVVLGMAGTHDSGWLQNFAPVAAIALCGAAYLPKRTALALPLGSLLLSDVILNVFCYHEALLTWQIIPRYVALALISGIGFLLRDRVRIPGLIVGSVTSSIVFYIITNTGSWLGDPGYVKTLGGWVQALTTGLPGYRPTYTFYTHTLISDVLFTLLFAGCVLMQSKQRTATAEMRPTAA